MLIRGPVRNIGDRDEAVGSVCGPNGPIVGLIARVTDTIGVQVFLGGVGYQYAVVVAIGDPIAVSIGLARVADTVLVGVGLIHVGHQVTIVWAVEDPVVVIVGITRVPKCVSVIVGLVGVGGHRAVVRSVK